MRFILFITIAFFAFCLVAANDQTIPNARINRRMVRQLGNLKATVDSDSKVGEKRQLGQQFLGPSQHVNLGGLLHGVFGG